MEIIKPKIYMVDRWLDNGEMCEGCKKLEALREVAIALVDLNNSGLWETNRVNLQLNKIRDILELW